ncbi:hypothetical protein SODALDRAFT_358487 [Sodiomyces alkalinus F11]|uniref:Uncharacterized protein n=1 Tax=Sodiomyces alkalinus (strain CBS 110278 / VKM F-3762 / F11) TaxID=1314773 RepID=A0A3N2PZZ1_SODAK|nr:hypothetical protein SODALDRAFT_358487 [Sodiomyces alkalinus F11]ROT40063.1 hypothetical protein SODALDRAFT_358487 [Sodiomyces alkalinus F11]
MPPFLAHSPETTTTIAWEPVWTKSGAGAQSPLLARFSRKIGDDDRDASVQTQISPPSRRFEKLRQFFVLQIFSHLRLEDQEYELLEHHRSFHSFRLTPWRRSSTFARKFLAFLIGPRVWKAQHQTIGRNSDLGLTSGVLCTLSRLLLQHLACLGLHVLGPYLQGSLSSHDTSDTFVSSQTSRDWASKGQCCDTYSLRNPRPPDDLVHPSSLPRRLPLANTRKSSPVDQTCIEPPPIPSLAAFDSTLCRAPAAAGHIFLEFVSREKFVSSTPFLFIQISSTEKGAWDTGRLLKPDNNNQYAGYYQYLAMQY